MKKKILLGLLIFIVVIITLVLYSTRVDHSGWGEITDELLEYQKKLETQGYLTEDDLNEIKRIQDEQLDLINWLKNPSKEEGINSLKQSNFRVQPQ